MDGDCRRDIFVGSGTLVPASAVADDAATSAATAAAAKRLAE
jgi:hypothetical protein